MTSEQFAYWLQGFSELNETAPTPEQWALIKSHLGLVFQKVTPPLRGQSDLGLGQYVRGQQAFPEDLLRAKSIC